MRRLTFPAVALVPFLGRFVLGVFVTALLVSALLVAALLVPAALAAAPKKPAKASRDADDVQEVELAPGGPTLGSPLVQQVRIGVQIRADLGPCENLVMTMPVPINWPEQKVRQVSEDISPLADPIDFRDVGTVRQMLVKIPHLPQGQEAVVSVTFEVTRHSLDAPQDTGGFQVADSKKLPREMKSYLGPSPFIESTNGKIKSLAKEVGKDKQGWEKVQAFYDWVRENIEPSPEPIPLKGAIRALKDKQGDCEDLSSLFIALCRSSNIPARTVWVPQHCYPEFYLEDEAGVGHWFPCEPHGSPAFGGIPEHRPVLQKGDSFTVPERPRDKQRYVAQYCTGERSKPKVKWILEVDGKSVK